MDLQPHDGYVVLARDNEFIIDQDKTTGIAVGDIFSVVGEGETLFHPVTNKAIGTLDTIKSVLRVVRLDDGFSFAHPIGDGGAIKRGDQIRRFGGLKAIFWDYSESNRQLFSRLQSELPELKWQDYRAAQNSRPSEPSPVDVGNDTLFFVVETDRLAILDGEFNPIRSYSLDSVGGKSSADDSGPQRSENETTTKDPIGKSDLSPSSAALKTASSMDYAFTATDSPLHNTTLMSDLLHQYDGGHLLATTDGSKISIFRMGESLEPIAETQTTSFDDILAVKWWYPEKANTPYLAVLSWIDERIDSTIYALSEKGLTVAAANIKSILGT
ncbi:MAG TPA: hypothetical protein VJ969_06865, partial [Desulfopila sp.]|nr:hypothetical protein [Desulfopila sp.]